MEGNLDQREGAIALPQGHEEEAETDLINLSEEADVWNIPSNSSEFPKPKKQKKTKMCHKDLEEIKRPKLRTSKDVYDRLKWDSGSIILTPDLDESLDLSSIYIGYKDRFLGMCEVPFLDFVPLATSDPSDPSELEFGDEVLEEGQGTQGEIPFHRVYYFRTGGPPVDPFVGKKGEVKVREDNLPQGYKFIWDRDSRTDLVFHSGNSTSVL